MTHPFRLYVYVAVVLAWCLTAALVRGQEIPPALLAADAEVTETFVVRSARRLDTKLILNSHARYTDPGNRAVVLPFDKVPEAAKINDKVFRAREVTVTVTGRPAVYKRDGREYPQVEAQDPAKVRWQVK